MATKPIPDGYRTATPYLIIKGAAEAIEFYKRALAPRSCCAWPTRRAGWVTPRSRSVTP